MLFTNFDLTPDDYVPLNIVEPKPKANPKYPNILYNKKNEVVGITWVHGETIFMEFTTTGTVTWGKEDSSGVYETAETYLRGKRFKLMIVNARYEVVATAECDAYPHVRVLTDTFRPHTLDEGVYKMRLDLIDEEGHTLHTLIKPEDMIIYVK